MRSPANQGRGRHRANAAAVTIHLTALLYPTGLNQRVMLHKNDPVQKTAACEEASGSNNLRAIGGAGDCRFRLMNGG